jgi:predicted dehydrogenase
MERLKTGLVGCGKVGHLHAPALTRLSESVFTACCDADFDRAKRFAAQYGVKAYADVGEMVTQCGIQAVTICTPHPVHAAPAIAAIRAGAHVIIEKPLASTLEDCDAILAAARAAGIKTSTICQRRFYAPCQRIRRAIDEGKIGNPILGIVTMYGWRDEAYYAADPWRGKWREEGGGVLVNQSPHQLDLLQWYMGPIDELFAFWGNLNHPYIEVEDTALAVIRFKNGGLGNIMVSNSQNPALYCRVYVHGSNGASLGVQTDGGAMFVAGMSNILEPPVNDLWTVRGEEHLLTGWKQEDTDFFQKVNAIEYYHQLQLQDFLQAILQNREPYITGEEGRKTVELFTAIYRSQRDGRPVKFPFLPETGRSDMDGRLAVHHPI